MNEKFTRGGVFSVTPKRKMHGTLTLDGENSSLKLWDIDNKKRPIERDHLGDRTIIEGILDNQKRVSLIDCLYHGPSTYGSAEGASHHHSFFPHFAVVGGPRFNGEIRGASFALDDTETLFHDQRPFGHLSLGEENLRKLLREAGVSVEDDAHPVVNYWTGDTKILSTQTPMGRISVRHRPTETLGWGSSPPSITNKVTISVIFPKPVDMRGLQQALERLLQFFGIIIGRPQNLLEITIPGKYRSGLPDSSDVYLNMFSKRLTEYEHHHVDFRDTLIDAVGKADEFCQLMSEWLNRSETWRLARSRFMAGWRKQHDYDEDRLVGAVNMFDLLPDDAVPSTPSLTKELREAIVASQGLIKAVPKSKRRDTNILTYLGKIAKQPTLKDKIKYRATKVLTDATKNRLPEIDRVINAAVDLRHLYVHGDTPDGRRAKLIGCLPFLTDTLEFIFATSDLAESGWDFGSWPQHRALHHPFGRYLMEYKWALADLKKRRDK